MFAHRLFVVVSSVIFSGVLSSCTAKGPGSSASVPEPLAIDTDKVLAYVAIPSVDRLLRDVIAFADEEGHFSGGFEGIDLQAIADASRLAEEGEKGRILQK